METNGLGVSIASRSMRVRLAILGLGAAVLRHMDRQVMKISSRLWATAVLAGFVGTTYGQTLQGGRPQATSPTHKQIIEEVVHSFTVQTYRPEIPLPERESLVGGASRPEDLLSSWAHAMRSKGYEAVLKHWDASSRQRMHSLDSASGKTPADWERDWKRLFDGNKVVITHQVKYEPYVLFAIQIRNSANQPVLSDTLVLQNREGKWLLTYDLADSVVLTKWNSSQVRVQRLAVPLYKRAESR